VGKFKVGDLVRWKAARAERPYLGIVLEERAHPVGRYRVQWFTDNNSIGNHPEAILMKARVRGV
jgi:hypothetical protein